MDFMRRPEFMRAPLRDLTIGAERRLDRLARDRHPAETMLQVGIDTNSLFTTQAGCARYVKGLLRGLRSLPPDVISPVEVAWPVPNLDYHQPQRALRTFYRELVWARFMAPHQLQRQAIKLFHSTANVIVSPGYGITHVATLHDLAMLRHPERFRAWHLWSARRGLERLKRADRVICISEFTAREAVELLKLESRRLTVVYNGCDFHPDEPQPRESAPAFEVPKEFFLFVGSIEPGKNLALLNATYELARRHGRELPPLLVMGVTHSGLESVGHADTPGWLYLGRQPDSVLVYLLRRAIALVFPSRYEGFGLPVAEAMALDCPVICSPVASLPEVGGDAVCFVPHQPEAYLEALLGLANHPDRRTDLIRRGRAQAQRFSWSRCARETADVYHQAIDNPDASPFRHSAQGAP
jgi:glycosyltransferase involved in cell wall biosynthesis